MAEEDEHKVVLHVSNIGLDVKSVDVWRHFADIGIIKIYKLYNDGEADIMYFDSKDVQEAICKYDKKSFKGKILLLSQGDRM